LGNWEQGEWKWELAWRRQLSLWNWASCLPSLISRKLSSKGNNFI
jgi:hypothetical protein